MIDFTPYDRQEFIRRINQFSWKRRITEVIIHHTWRPNHDQWYEDERVLEHMYYDIQRNGQTDFDFHVLITPDGEIITGQNWNVPTSGIPSGTRQAGPFVITMVGDFDIQQDELTGEQLKSAQFACGYLLWKFRLPLKACKFHRHYVKSKTCPGSAITYEWWINDIKDLQIIEGMRTE